MNEKSLVSLFHTLGDETVKQASHPWNTERNKDETSSLKALAYKALERLQRNKDRNKNETKDEKFVSRSSPCETRNIDPKVPFLIQLSSLPEDDEERLAIAEYDGHQTSIQARRIAYQDAFISVLNTLPYEDAEEGDWFEARIRATRECLLSQDIRQPE